jgi:hypothetical protein
MFYFILFVYYTYIYIYLLSKKTKTFIEHNGLLDGIDNSDLEQLRG